MTELALEHLRVDRRDSGIVLVTLDLPERRNAMSAPMTESWRRLMDELRSDRSVRCVVVTGAGTAFCSGGDTGWIGSEPDATVDQLRDRMLPFYRTWLSIRDLEVPTIAAINGPAVGAGACLALACDLRYAAEDAKIAVPFTALGLHPGMAATWLLPEVAGLAVARELLLTGRAVTGTEAVGLGLVNRVFPGEKLLDEVVGVAERVAGMAPIATRLTKVALANGGHASLEDALRWEALAQPVTLATEDLHEGLRAQREKRRPRFSGR
ncbi:enoyl-CoA hydratase [Carbonactinospora thermoautotrophica]|uniref:Enoyl-CoA hydratase n=1 Tax=Carbonactinospora thermoautotrophica TaxID=1469144 RepID=A0A132NH40_9ACTN|nr:enoyl-CoA hydratase-related protein [Carbonactinospora thermoautotrophica]KWX04192.1 enoyl-CoA hydratase [Carbonactinospora thermoautotrophica]KWX09455.1 enoyl-CoA hydratase [Carbonactinospora thermoautotrophica]